MKTTTIMLCTATILILTAACNNQNRNKQWQHRLSDTNTDTFSVFIPIDTANKMLGSYLASIGYLHNDTDLQSLIIDVNQLRKYIDSLPESSNITHLKLMFAHSLRYTNSPLVNTNAGYKSNALTLIIAAYNANGDYVYYTGNTVLDYSQPCPPVCPPGNAANAFLTH